MTVRKAPNRGVKGKNIGKFFSVKMNTTLWFESLLEMYLMYLLDFDPGVKFFKEQPCRIRYVHDGKLHQYTPDLFVLRTDKTQIVEVKRQNKVTTEENDLLFRIISPICQCEGLEFVVFTNETIMLQPRLNNIICLWRYARTPIRPHHQILCQEFLHKQQPVSLAEVFEFFYSKGLPKQVVYALLFWGVIDFDLMQQISPDSLIYMPSGSVHTHIK